MEKSGGGFVPWKGYVPIEKKNKREQLKKKQM